MLFMKRGNLGGGGFEIGDTEIAAAAAKSLQSCLTLCDTIDGSPPGSPFPGILQARTRVGCHFLLQCRKVKSENEVAQSCLTVSDPMDCSPPGSSFHGIFQARVLEWVATAFSACKYYVHLTSRNHIDLILFYFLGISLAGSSTFFSIYTLFPVDLI